MVDSAVCPSLPLRISACRSLMLSIGVGFGSPQATKVLLICECRSTRSVSTRMFGLVRRSDWMVRCVFSFSAANTMVSDLPLPCVCQISPCRCLPSMTRSTMRLTARNCW
ncbi:hypothetical protein D3C80_1872870 [compost metagenome]